MMRSASSTTDIDFSTQLLACMLAVATRSCRFQLSLSSSHPVLSSNIWLAQSNAACKASGWQMEEHEASARWRR